MGEHSEAAGGRSAAGLWPGALARDPHLPGSLLRFTPNGSKEGHGHLRGRAGQVPREHEGAGWKLPTLSSQVHGSTIQLLLPEQSGGSDVMGGQGPPGASAVSQGWGQAPNLLVPLWGPWAVYRASHISHLTMGRNPHQ